MSFRTLLVVVALSAVLVGHASAQADLTVHVTSEAEPMEVQTDETVTFTVRVDGPSATMVQTPSLPSTTNLEAQQRAPSTRHSSSSAEDVAFTWEFRPQEPGPARIGPVEVVVAGEIHRSDEIRIQVTQPAEGPSAATLSRRDASSGSSAVLDSRDLFIRASASAGRAYQNEQLTVEYRLFYRPGIRLRHSRLADAWDAPSFWREELDVASRPVPRTRQAYGREYKTIVLKRVALFPTRPGTLHVDPLRIEAEAQGMISGQRGPAVRSRFEPVQLTSRSLSFTVRDLPASAPPSFDGAVGQFDMSVRVDADSIAVGDPVRLMVQVRGTGNLATLPPPELDVPSAFEAYEPSVETNLDRSGQQIGGTKTFTYSLVARAGGRHDLPPVTFSYFDPDTRRYETLRSDLPVVDVAGTAAARTVGRTGDGLPVGDITALAEASEAEWVRTDRRPLHRRPWVYVILLVPVVGAAGTVVYRRRQESGDSIEASTSEGALGAADDRLQEARRRVQNGAPRSIAYDAIEQAVSRFLDERLDAGGVGSPRVALERQLARRNVPEDLRTDLYDVLDRCGEAQFAPDGSAPVSASALLDRAESILRRLDACL